MKLGCHAVLFKGKIKSDTEEILKGLASTGFKGFEMGSRFFGTEDKDYFIKLLDKYQLELSGMHVGAPLEVWVDNPDEQITKVLEVAKFVSDMPNKNVIMSGSKFPDGDVVTAAKNIDKAALECKKMGVKLNYHNHGHEFMDNGRIYNALVEFAPNLNFAFDLGWIYKGGYDPIKVIKDNKNRTSYVHLRDGGELEGRDFPDLGQGNFDYKNLMETVESVVGEDGWAVVEYESGEEDFGRYVEAREFLRKLGY